MNDIAEIVEIKLFGKNCYKMNVINANTGMYYNSSSRYFGSKKEAIEFAKENELTIKTK